MGFGLSTTQVCSGGIMGAGKAGRTGRVNWSTVRKMAYAWGLTLPSAALLGGGGALLVDRGAVGEVLLALIGVGASVWIYLLSRRQRIDAGNVVDASTVGDGPTPLTTVPAATGPIAA